MREMRAVSSAERAAERRVEAQLAEVASCNAAVLSMESGATASAVDKGLQAVVRHAQALMAAHAEGLQAHYQLAWNQGRAELHGDNLKDLQAAAQVATVVPFGAGLVSMAWCP